MKKLSVFLAIMLAVSILTGCGGTAVVYYNDCTCPSMEAAGSEADIGNEKPTGNVDAVSNDTQSEQPNEEYVPQEGELKTGLWISASVSGSAQATAEASGKASFDVNYAAVLVDQQGVIVACKVDSLGHTIGFDASGAIVADLGGEILTKGELGEAYGMKSSGSKLEWNEQAALLAEFVVGKTAEELRNGFFAEDGSVADADLAASASIYLGGYLDTILSAVDNAWYLGAMEGDELRLAVISSNTSTTPAAEEASGNAQLDSDVTALTLRDGVITSCVIDSLQAKVPFTVKGELEADTSVPVLSKNQLKEDYMMKAYGSAYEWYEQAAFFAGYVTGKTAAEVTGIAIDEGTKPVEEDLKATVSIAVGGFMSLIQKAAA